MQMYAWKQLYLENIVLTNFAWLPKHCGMLCCSSHIQKAGKAAEDIVLQ